MKIIVHPLQPFEFVNRSQELQELRKRVYPQAQTGTSTFLRSPSGFGKSRLTDRLLEEIPTDGLTCIIVDPAIRSKSRSERVYAWFFVQRAAEPSARRCTSDQKQFLTFADFLRKRSWRKINWKSTYENFKGSASISGITKTCIELFESLLKFGRYRPSALLQEDSSFAGDVAREYLLALTKYQPTLFVIRESQNIDPESLAFFLALEKVKGPCFLIFEYTTDNGNFSMEHEKVIFETVAEKSTLAIFDLLKLNLKEFRFLLTKYASEDQNFETTADIKWDGNLRIIRELKYRLMVGRGVESASYPLNLRSEIEKNVASLSSEKKLILALVTVHVEAIERRTLAEAFSRIDPLYSFERLARELLELENQEGYLRSMGDNISIADEDLIDAITKLPSMTPMLRLSAVSLRDFYLDVLNGSLFTATRLQSALRQAVSLCALTGDIFALRNLIKVLESNARRAQSQILYISVIADVVLSRSDLSELERRELCGWTVAAAYEAGDSPTAMKLIQLLPFRQPYDNALLACCYGNINRHEDALLLADELKLNSEGLSTDVALAGNLIEFLSTYALGKKREALSIHEALRQKSAYFNSPLFGYVLRFTELIKDFPDCNNDVLASVDAFHLSGLRKSAAYSQAAGAMHMAYSGQLDVARQLMAEADEELRPFLCDRQLLINNAVVIELLTGSPDLQRCIEQLRLALFTVSDDFSRFTLYNNLLICYALTNDELNAIHIIEVIDRILAAPGFGNRDIFVTVCYNVWKFLNDIGQSAKAGHYEEIALSVNLNKSCYPDYWKKRFGLQSEADPKFDFLLRLKYHPDYLSHWLIDIDGLNALKEESAQ